MKGPETTVLNSVFVHIQCFLSIFWSNQEAKQDIHKEENSAFTQNPVNSFVDHSKIRCVGALSPCSPRGLNTIKLAYDPRRLDGWLI